MMSIGKCLEHGLYSGECPVCSGERDKFVALLRVARAAKEWAEYCPPRSRTKREQAIHDALKEVEDLL